MKHPVLIAAVAATVTAFSASCGSSTAKSIGQKIVPPGQGQIPTASLSSLTAQQWQTMQGTYTETLYKDNGDGTYLTQPASFVLTSQAFSGQNYAYVTFSSAPSGGNQGIGTISFSSYLNVGTQPNGSETVFGFMSSVQSLPVVSEDPVTFMLLVSLKAGANNTFTIDPTQSGIFIMDCGFSQTSCSDVLSDPAFGTDLGKH